MTGNVAIIKNGDDRIEYLSLPDGIARGARPPARRFTF